MQIILAFTVLVCLFIQGQSAITGNATCDNTMYFYADGVQKIYNTVWPTSSPVNIPDSTQVVAIRCKDFGVVGGIKAALSNGVKTDTTWKCSNKYERNWNKPGFDDSAWSNAVKPTFNWGTAPASLNGIADWIWTSGWRGQDKDVYCRKVIKKADCCEELKKSVAVLNSKVDKLIAMVARLSFPRPVFDLPKPVLPLAKTEAKV